jgi:hypothetical protein
MRGIDKENSAAASHGGRGSAFPAEQHAAFQELRHQAPVGQATGRTGNVRLHRERHASHVVSKRGEMLEACCRKVEGWYRILQ